MSVQNLEIRRSSASVWGSLSGMRTATTVSKYIDTTTCIGCKACEAACIEWNDLRRVATQTSGTYQTLPTLDANSNILMAKEISGNGDLDSAHFNRITDLLGLTKRLNHRPSELSGGEQQRVALARALINKPTVVLADEPTGNLDSKNSEIVLDMLRLSNKELGQTVMMITHNPQAAEYGDRIIHMRDGQIVNPEDDPQWSHH